MLALDSKTIRSRIFSVLMTKGEAGLSQELLSHPEYISELVRLGIDYLKSIKDIPASPVVVAAKPAARMGPEPIPAGLIGSRGRPTKGKYIKHCPVCQKPGFLDTVFDPYSASKVPIVKHGKAGPHRIARQLKKLGIDWKKVVKGEQALPENIVFKKGAELLVEDDGRSMADKLAEKISDAQAAVRIESDGTQKRYSRNN